MYMYAFMYVYVCIYVCICVLYVYNTSRIATLSISTTCKPNLAAVMRTTCCN